MWPQPMLATCAGAWATIWWACPAACTAEPSCATTTPAANLPCRGTPSARPGPGLSLAATHNTCAARCNKHPSYASQRRAGSTRSPWWTVGLSWRPWQAWVIGLLGRVIFETCGCFRTNSFQCDAGEEHLCFFAALNIRLEKALRELDGNPLI